MREKFTLRNSLLSTAQIAGGVGALMAFYRLPPHIQTAKDSCGWYALALYLLSGSLIGAGMLLPFGFAGFGLVWGYLVMLALFIR